MKAQTKTYDLFCGDSLLFSILQECITRELREHDKFVTSHNTTSSLAIFGKAIEFTIVGTCKASADIFEEFKACIERQLQEIFKQKKTLRRIVAYLQVPQGLTFPIDAHENFWLEQKRTLRYCIYLNRGEDADLINSEFQRNQRIFY